MSDAFRAAVVRDAGLQARLRLAKTTDEVVSMAQAAGFEVGAADIESLTNGGTVSLSEAELESVSGALPCWCDPSVVNSKSCAAN